MRPKARPGHRQRSLILCLVRRHAHMTLRKFLLTTTTASLLLTSVPIGLCAVVATQRHSSRIWEVFVSVSLVASMILAVASLVSWSVSFYRRDFGVGIFALWGGLLVFFSLWIFIGSINVY